MHTGQFTAVSESQSSSSPASDWTGGAQLTERQCVEIEDSTLDTSVSAVLAGVPTGESISRSAFSGESSSEASDREFSGVFEGLLGQNTEKPGRYSNAASNRLRDSNRLSTRQLLAHAGVWRGPALTKCLFLLVFAVSLAWMISKY